MAKFALLLSKTHGGKTKGGGEGGGGGGGEEGGGGGGWGTAYSFFLSLFIQTKRDRISQIQIPAKLERTKKIPGKT